MASAWSADHINPEIEAAKGGGKPADQTAGEPCSPRDQPGCRPQERRPLSYGASVAGSATEEGFRFSRAGGDRRACGYGVRATVSADFATVRRFGATEAGRMTPLVVSGRKGEGARGGRDVDLSVEVSRLILNGAASSGEPPTTLEI